MDKMQESVKSILDDARDRYYGKPTTKKASTDPEKFKPLKDVVPPVKDSESTSKEVRKEDKMEKSASSASAASPPKRTVKKGKKILRKSNDSLVVPSQEVALEKPTEMAEKMITRVSEEDNPANLFSLNISEEVASYDKIFPSAEITSQPLEKKTNSRSPSHSSGEVPPKKRKIDEDSLSVDNVEAMVNDDPVVAEEGQNSIAHVVDTRQEDLITDVVALDKAPGIDPVTDVQAADPIDEDKNEEELAANNTKVTADHLVANIDNSLLSTQNIPPADPIIIIDEQPMTVESNVISNEEFQAFRAEMAKLKEEVVRLRGELIDVKKNQEDKAKAPEADKSEDFMRGVLCLLQRLVRTGVLSPEEAMNPLLWKF